MLKKRYRVSLRIHRDENLRVIRREWEVEQLGTYRTEKTFASERTAVLYAQRNGILVERA